MSYNPQNPNGQATSANSQPVVIASDQSAIPITASSLPLPTNASQDGVDGTGITPPTGGSGIRGWLSGIFSKISTLVTSGIGRTWTLASGTDSVTVQGGNATAVKVDGSTVTQPISAAALPLPTSASTSANQATEITALNLLHTDITTAPLPAGTNALGSITANAGTNLNTSALALETGGNLASLNTKTPAVGQAVSASSRPVVIASDQSAINVSQVDVTNLLNTTYNAIGPGAALNTSGFQVISLQINGTIWSGLAMIEGSEDNVNWSRLIVINVNEPSIIDQITTNGNYIIQVVTKYIRLNVLNITGTITAVASGRSGAGIDMGSMLTLALDEKNNVALHTKIDNIKTDTQLAIVESDCPAPIYGQAGALNQALCVIDTQGYESLSVELFGNWGGQIGFVGSNDPGFGTSNNVYAVQVNQGLQALLPNTAFGANGLFMLPAYCRYIKIYANVYSSGQMECLVYLRKAPFNIFVQPIGQTIAAGLTAPGSTLTVASYNTNPVPMGGADSGNLARRVLVDSTGKLITLLQSTDQFGIQRNIGVQPNIFQNQAAVLTQDVSQFEGQTSVELLQQILVEMKIMNERLRELPYRLIASQPDTDDTSAFRNDPSFLQ